jgi:hypothetical protein
MSDNIDFRLKILGRYRQGGPWERFNLWFGHPGLRREFDLLDRKRPEARGGADHWVLGRMGLRPEAGPRTDWARARSGLSLAGFWPARSGSPDKAASGGTGRGR